MRGGWVGKTLFWRKSFIFIIIYLKKNSCWQDLNLHLSGLSRSTFLRVFEYSKALTNSATATI